MQLVRLDTNTLNKMLIGWDRMFEEMENRWANSVQSNYPPHNVIKTGENTYEIQLAVSGFDKKEITVEIDQNQLVIQGQRNREEESVSYLYRGLATRDFQRVFPLADHIEVKSSSIRNGVLSIHLERVIPESLKPRRIEIKGE